MTLAAGSRLGPYEILSAIGAGGMGEVYKARDTRLDRTVAVKVLPDHLSKSEDVRQRFEREAKTISQLSHPHICALYDVGHEGETQYLVMEYLEGETLAERLVKGALPLEQSLRYGVEIADALDKAHRQGIVHRDLKPGNVMLTKSGVKLLDFGLAKALQPEPPIESLTSVPTAQRDVTREGTILGTLPYMAPEQLEGKKADPRTDIFALGATLYEMATGNKAFSGLSQASLISAIMSSEPASIAAVQPMAPPALDRVVGKCLAKDPEDRWQSASDLKSELEWIGREGQGRQAPASARGKGALWAAAGLLVGLAAAGLLLLRGARPPAVPPAVSRFVLALPPIDRLADLNLALSPDGRTLVFCASTDETRRLFSRPLDRLESTAIPGTEGADCPFFSPDGRWVGFFSDGSLKKVALAGGSPLVICPAANVPGGGSWGPDDTILFTVKSAGLLRVRSSGGAPTVVARPDPSHGTREFSTPLLLPGATHALVSARLTKDAEERVFAVDLTTGRANELFVGDSPRLARTGQLLYTRGGSLLAVRFDAGLATTDGPAVSVLDGVEGGSDYSTFDISGDGTLVYVPTTRRESRVVWVERDGRRTAITREPERFRYPRLSPDGRKIVVSLPSSSGVDVWVYDIESGTRSRVTSEGVNMYPTWTRDGARIAFISVRANSGGVFWTAAEGGAPAQLLVPRTDSGNPFPAAFSPDGKYLLYDTFGDIWIYSLADGKSSTFAASPFQELGPVFSPDGRWIAYQSNESGRDEVYARPFPGSGGRVTVSTSGGRAPVWSEDGREIFFRHGNAVMSAAVTFQPAFHSGTPQRLFEGEFEAPSTGGNPYYDVSRDGKRFVMLEIADATKEKQLHAVLHADEEVRRLLPGPSR